MVAHLVPWEVFEILGLTWPSPEGGKISLKLSWKYCSDSFLQFLQRFPTNVTRTGVCSTYLLKSLNISIAWFNHFERFTLIYFNRTFISIIWKFSFKVEEELPILEKLILHYFICMSVSTPSSSQTRVTWALSLYTVTITFSLHIYSGYGL